MITRKIGHSHPLDIITKSNKTERGKMRKNNITLSLENIISFSRNITSHFTGEAKIITLVSIIIMLSFANIIFTSALSYQGSAEINFTFNPTLSVNISSSDLTISNLTPGTTSDSNIINVSVATNASHGYTLSAIVNGDNSNLTHANGTNVFSSIATNSSLSSLTTDNTWGYNYKNNLASISTWSSYSGLSNLASKILFNTDSNSSSSIDFKIAAKAGETQPSGTYTGTINFIATTKPMPKTIQDIAYMQTFAELDAVDLASVKSSMIINSAYILKDIRDEKEYYVTRLEDGNVWMTQNLDLDLDPARPLTSNDTDLTDHSLDGAYADGYNYDSNTGITVWTPARKTIDFQNTTVTGWINDNNKPYSASKTDGTETGHASFGNYYNWTAAIASNYSRSLTLNTLNNIANNPRNSICPKGWRLPTISDQSETESGSTNEFARLNFLYNNNYNDRNTGLISAPLYFSTPGYIDQVNISGNISLGRYLSSTYSNTKAYMMNIDNRDNNINNDVAIARGKFIGYSVRCIAR